MTGRVAQTAQSVPLPPALHPLQVMTCEQLISLEMVFPTFANPKVKLETIHKLVLTERYGKLTKTLKID